MGRLRGGVPAPLAWLLAVAALEFLAWALFVPALQQPDEASHASYTQRLVERQELPFDPDAGERTGLRGYSSEMRTALVQAGLEPLRGNLSARPLWTDVDEGIWRARDRALPDGARADGGPTSSLVNPPLYYAYEAVPYVAAGGGSFFDRLYLMRLANLPFLLLIVAGTWLLARELLNGSLLPAALASGVVALHPLLASISSGVNPDVLLAALSTWALYLMVLVVRRGPAPGLLLALGALCAAAALAHPRGVPLLVPALLAILLSVRRHRPPRSPGLRRGLVAASLAAVVLLAYAALRYATAGEVSGERVRELGSYLWQFYLPGLPFMEPPIGGDWGVRDVFVDRFFGTFVQLEVFFSDALLGVLLAASLVGLAALVAALFARRERLRSNGDVLAVLGTALVASVLFLHLIAYRSLLYEPDDPVMTGRYLLPLISLFGLALAFTVSALPRRLAAAGAGAVVAGAAGLQVYALALVVARFYA